MVNKVNNNPYNKQTCDCVVRSIACATGMEYFEVVNKLLQIYINTGYHIADKKCYYKLLKELGYTRIQQPKKEDNSKYTGKEFCLHLINDNKSSSSVIAHIGTHHVVCIKDGVIQDTQDCSNNYVGVVWIKLKEVI